MSILFRKILKADNFKYFAVLKNLYRRFAYITGKYYALC